MPYQKKGKVINTVLKYGVRFSLSGGRLKRMRSNIAKNVSRKKVHFKQRQYVFHGKNKY